MNRVDEAMLAFIGTGEVRGKPLSASENAATPQGATRIQRLVDACLIEITDDKLYVTTSGWHYLDNRLATTPCT